MKFGSGTWRRLVGAAGLAAAIVALASPAAAQTVTFPQWMRDSASTSNRYLMIWEYITGANITRFNIWTEEGDPFNVNDNFYFVTTVDNNGNIVIVRDWGSRIWSGVRPGPPAATGGDDRPFGNVVALRVEDPTATGGFTTLLYPDNGAAVLSPPVVDLPDNQGYFAPYTMTAAASGIDLTVNQKTVFARDLIRVEVVVRNNSGATRRVGARMLLDPYVDFQGPTRSVFIPETRERVFFEKDYVGGQVPAEWEIYDNDESANPTWVAKAILKGNGATTPSRLVIGNMLDIYPFALGTAAGNYDWIVRPDFELRIADIGSLVYWDPITIPPGQSRSFVTYIGMGVASHGMSDAYVATQSQASIADFGQGFIGAAQAPFALPLVNGDSDTTEHTFTAFCQNAFNFVSPNAFAFIDLPDGLQFGTSDPTQAQRVDFGSLSPVGFTGDEGTGQWTIMANGLDAGILPVVVTFGNGFFDTARAIRNINVPQGRRYQFNDGWKMVTFPFSFTALQDDPVDVFKQLDGVTPLNPGTFQIVRYNPLIGAYEQVDELRAGESYWVRMLGVGDTDVRLGPQAQPIKLTTRDLFTSVLQPRWNQVGNPSPYVVRVRDIRFLATGGILLTFDQAVASGFIRPSLYRWNTKTRVYDLLTRDSLIKPGDGIWIFAASERTIVWPAPYGIGLSITP